MTTEDKFRYVVRALPNRRKPQDDPIVAEFKYASDAFAFAHLRRDNRFRAETRDGRPIGGGWVSARETDQRRDAQFGHGAKVLDILDKQ